MTNSSPSSPETPSAPAAPPPVAALPVLLELL